MFVHNYNRPVSGGCMGCKVRSLTVSNGLQGDCEKQNPILHSIVLIHNFRTELVGSNQIKTIFNREYECIVNIDGYDRISQYYLSPEDFDTVDGSI